MKPGDRFKHANWFNHRLEPAIVEVVSVRPDSYKGNPFTVVRVQEVDGNRSAAYPEKLVPRRPE